MKKIDKLYQKLEYEKIESGEDSLRHLKVEPKANLKPEWGKFLTKEDLPIPLSPKPILYIQLPGDSGISFENQQHLEKLITDAGWMCLMLISAFVSEIKIQAFTLKDSQEIQVQELQEIILTEIKGK